MTLPPPGSFNGTLPYTYLLPRKTKSSPVKLTYLLYFLHSLNCSQPLLLYSGKNATEALEIKLSSLKFGARHQRPTMWWDDVIIYCTIIHAHCVYEATYYSLLLPTRSAQWMEINNVRFILTWDYLRLESSSHSYCKSQWSTNMDKFTNPFDFFLGQEMSQTKPCRYNRLLWREKLLQQCSRSHCALSTVEVKGEKCAIISYRWSPNKHWCWWHCVYIHVSPL